MVSKLYILNSGPAFRYLFTNFATYYFILLLYFIVVIQLIISTHYSSFAINSILLPITEHRTHVGFIKQVMLSNKMNSKCLRFLENKTNLNLNVIQKS